MHPTVFCLFFLPLLCSCITLDRKIKHSEELEVLEITEDNDSHRPTPNNRPVIGILTQPSAWPKFFDPEDFSYIAASYVKYLEMAGARVIPIKHNLNKTELNKVFGNLNGLLLPGGGSDLLNERNENFTDFYESGNYLINLAKKSNENGEYFPVWGTCLGFEMMILSIAEDKKVLSLFNSTNHSMKLKFLKSTLMSKLFSRMREKLKYYLSHENFMYFNHRFGVEIKTFNQNQRLREFFDILTINSDKNGKMFVSAIEAKEFPFFGVQFHPEKNSFEWQEHLEINHSPSAIEVQQYFANFFVNEARKNPKAFNNSKEERKEFISNFYPIPLSESFVNVYVFTKPTVKDLFKLNIHSKRFLNFIQNFKHNNNVTDSHSTNNHTGNPGVNATNSSNSSNNSSESNTTNSSNNSSNSTEKKETQSMKEGEKANETRDLNSSSTSYEKNFTENGENQRNSNIKSTEKGSFLKERPGISKENSEKGLNFTELAKKDSTLNQTSSTKEKKKIFIKSLFDKNL